MGDRDLDTEHMEKLFLELSSLEDRGITIWLNGIKSDSKNAVSQLCVNEECTYMRDYVIDEGVIKELHFDKIK